MVPSLKIAFRYVFSRKKKSLINLITFISVVSLVIGTIALTVVLSAFNGLDGLIRGLYESFDADLKIASTQGKSFVLTPDIFQKITSIAGVESASQSIEETAYIKYHNKEHVVRIKGVDDQYPKTVKIEASVLEGSYVLQENTIPYAVVGYQVANQLGLNLQDFSPLKVYAAKRTGRYDVLNPESYFKTLPIYASGVFAISQDFDKKYVLVPIAFAKELFQMDTLEISALEINVSDDISEFSVKAQLEQKLGAAFSIKTRNELNDVVFKANKTEKWVTYFILIFVLIVCMFNLMGANTIMILDKKRDAFTLKSLGLSMFGIRKIFVFTGLIITLVASILGIIIGLFICYGQIYFKWLKIHQGVVDSYPIQVYYPDIAMIFVTVVFLGFLSSLIPVRLLVHASYLKKG